MIHTLNALAPAGGRRRKGKAADLMAMFGAAPNVTVKRVRRPPTVPPPGS